MPPELDSTHAIQKLSDSSTENWFEYPVRVQPHHTDYAGVVWHGAYVAWLEEARIECLRSLGIDYVDMVEMGCELPVVELTIRYHRVLRFGKTAIVKTRMMGLDGVRINWQYRIESPDAAELHVTAQVTLVAVDSEKGKIMRQLPESVKDALARLKS